MNRLSVKVLKSAEHVMAKNNEGINMHNAATILYKNKLIHEHDLITAKIKGTNTFLMGCTTCGIYYCKLCGKALQQKGKQSNQGLTYLTSA